MAFTTWTDLKSQMQDDMANFSWRRKKYESPGDGIAMEYTSFTEFKAAYEYVSAQADLENVGSGVCIGRTVARSGGRF